MIKVLAKPGKKNQESPETAICRKYYDDLPDKSMSIGGCTCPLK